jgi:hypothetical protein
VRKGKWELENGDEWRFYPTRCGCAVYVYCKYMPHLVSLYKKENAKDSNYSLVILHKEAAPEGLSTEEVKAWAYAQWILLK